MAYKRIENRQKIIKIIDHLISTKCDMSVIVKSDTTSFSSRVINADQNHPSLAKGTRSIIIIDKLLPEKGNNLIQSSPKVTLKFVVSDQPCSCSVNYIGISSMPPHFGFMLSMPEIIELEEKRIEQRVIHRAPDFLLAEIFMGKGTKDEKRYEMDVIDSSAHGLGLLLNEKNLDLLKRIKTGDTIKDIHFYASNAMLKIDGAVRHVTKIEEGKFKGCYNIGIDSKDFIPGGKTRK
jgi:hypothetical protein